MDIAVLMLYAFLFVPHADTIGSFPWLGGIACGIYMLYTVFRLSGRQDIFRPFLFLSAVSLGGIVWLSADYTILYPLALFPFIANWASGEPGFDKAITAAVLASAMSIFAADSAGGNITERLSFFSPAIFALVFPLLASRLDPAGEVDNEIKTERIMDLQQEVRSLQGEKKILQKGLKNKKRLSAVMELEYKGFDRNESVRRTITAAKNSAGALFVAMYRFDEDSRMFTLEAVTGKPQMLQKQVPMGTGVVGRTIINGRHIYVGSLHEKEENSDSLGALDALLGIPVISGSRVSAAMYVGLPRLSEQASDEVIAVCCSIADKLGLELEKIERHDAIEYKSRTDELTKVGNRQYFDEKIQEAFESGQPFAYVLLDLDYFKQMNDTHGHDFGDRVLCAAAETFASNIRDEDFVFRTGGDEFSLLLMGADKPTAFSIMKRIKESYAARVEKEHFYAKKDGVDVRSSISMGASVYPHDGINNPQELIKLADSAVYYVKEHGKNNLAIAK